MEYPTYSVDEISFQYDGYRNKSVLISVFRFMYMVLTEYRKHVRRVRRLATSQRPAPKIDIGQAWDTVPVTDTVRTAELCKYDCLIGRQCVPYCC